MKTLELNGVEILALDEIPQDAYDYAISNHTNIFYYKYNDEIISVYLPDEMYELLGWSDEITEEQAKELVKEGKGMFTGWFKNYEYKGGWQVYIYPFNTARESFQSFLQSQGITNRVYLIIKK